MEGEDTDTDNPRSFQKAAWWKRLIILVAGSATNFIAGFLLIILSMSASTGYVEPVIAQAEPGCTVIQEHGLHVGDRFLEINGEKVYTSGDISMLFAMGGDTHDILVERNGQKVLLEDYVMEAHLFKDEETGAEQMRYGFLLTSKPMDFGSLLRQGWKETVNTVRMVRLSLQMLFTGQAGIQDMTGPVGIVAMMSSTAQASGSFMNALLNMLYFGGFIAVNLAVMNMLPIPALDGGRSVALLLTTAIEKITGKKINPKYEGYIHGIGMLILLAFMAFILFKDVFSLFKG